LAEFPFVLVDVGAGDADVEAMAGTVVVTVLGDGLTRSGGDEPTRSGE
jgi:hypothetical protein